MIIRITFLLLFTFPSHLLYSQSEWVLRKEKNGIFIYVLKKDTGTFNSIKVETELPGNAEDLVAILMDVANHYKWSYGTKSAALIKRVSDHEIIFYKEIKSPGPVTDRDMVARLKVIRNSGAGSIQIEAEALPGFVPLKEDVVRVLRSNETWIVTNGKEEQKMTIKYFLQIDPGGSLPPLLVNLFVTRGPIESFESLKELLKKRITD
jgi:hypothetical protein